MDGSTPINTFEPQFSQKDAARLADVPMATINNWIVRKAFTFLAEGSEREGRRRLFSIADIARLHVMRFCTEHLEISPEAAASAAQGTVEYFKGSIREISREDGEQFEVWHWAHRTSDFLDGPRRWRIQGVWQNPETGAFYEYHPGIFSDEAPSGPPHFPCLCIPTSQLARRIFLACADELIADHEDQDTPVNAERPSTVTAPVGGNTVSTPGQIEDEQ